ncbi:unnamed protein product [Rotaria magnacalcarata]|nr:unnamed protein product [Rotaria magnacalcarata]
MPKRAVGIKRSWEELKKELDRTGSGYPGAVYFKTISAQGPQLFAVVNNDSVFYNDHGKWHRYITACNIQFGRMEFNNSNPDRSKSEDTISQLQTNESDWVFISHNGQEQYYLEEEHIQLEHDRNDSIFQHIFKYQITDLILYNNDEDHDTMSLITYIVNVYASIMVLFQNSQHLTVVSSPVNHYPPLCLSVQEQPIDFSSTLTVLCIKVLSLYDCLALLDG